MNVCGGCIISLRITAYRCFTTVIWAYVVYYNASWRGLSVLLIPGAEAMREPEDLGWARSRDSHVFFSIYPIFINRLFWGVLQGIYFFITMAKNKNEEFQSRRDFFKKAGKGILPVLGIVMLSSMPTIVNAAEKTPNGCSWGCSGVCQQTCTLTCACNCTSGCKTSCQSGCGGGCRGACYNSCSGSCKNSCSGSCRGSSS